MPNRDFHDITSTVVGGGYGLYRSSGQSDGARLLETFGAAAGGLLGGRVPDTLDPPTSPRHRGRAHSFVVAGMLVQFCAEDLPKWQHYCRERADQFAMRRRQCPAGSFDELTLALAEAFWRTLAGFLAGLPAGYLTHLGLDACTPACINVS